MLDADFFVLSFCFSLRIIRCAKSLARVSDQDKGACFSSRCVSTKPTPLVRNSSDRPTCFASTRQQIESRQDFHSANSRINFKRLSPDLISFRFIFSARKSHRQLQLFAFVGFVVGQMLFLQWPKNEGRPRGRHKRRRRKRRVIIGFGSRASVRITWSYKLEVTVGEAQRYL